MRKCDDIGGYTGECENKCRNVMTWLFGEGHEVWGRRMCELSVIKVEVTDERVESRKLFVCLFFSLMCSCKEEEQGWKVVGGCVYKEGQRWCLGVER